MFLRAQSAATGHTAMMFWGCTDGKTVGYCRRRLEPVLITIVVVFTLYLVDVCLWRKNLVRGRRSVSSESSLKLLFSIGIISDLQYSDRPPGINLDNGQPRYYREAPKNLQRAVDDWRRKKVNLVVNLGDVVDGGSEAHRPFAGRYLAKLEEVLSPLKTEGIPYYQLLGNHDLYNADPLAVNDAFTHSYEIRLSGDKSSPIDEYHPSIGLPHPNYRLSLAPHPTLRLILLNSFACSLLFGKQQNTPEYRLAKSLMARNRNDDNNNNRSVEANRWQGYNGGLGLDQLQWLEGELKAARSRKEKVVIFSHVPLHPKVTNYLAWDFASALRLFTAFNDVILMVVAGHNHVEARYHDSDIGIDFFTAKGSIEFLPDQNAHYILNFYQNKLCLDDVICYDY